MDERPRETAARVELERWYRLDLRPKVARAARRRAIEPAQAAALELSMAALLRPRGALAPSPRSRSKGTETNAH